MQHPRAHAATTGAEAAGGIAADTLPRAARPHRRTVAMNGSAEARRC